MGDDLDSRRIDKRPRIEFVRKRTINEQTAPNPKEVSDRRRLCDAPWKYSGFTTYNERKKLSTSCCCCGVSLC